MPQTAPPPLDRRVVIGLAFCAFIVVFVLWQFDSAVLFPFRLLVTFVHEMGHGLAAVLTGGRFVSFHVFGDGSGLAYTDGGLELAILPAGYLGSALFGAVLLYAANRVTRVKWVAFGCGSFFVATSLLFGGGGGWSLMGAVSSFFALLVGFVAGIALIALGHYGSRSVTVLVLNILAFTVGFNVISDFLWLLSHQAARLGEIPNDALAMARLTNMPTLTWIVIWAGAAILMVGIAAILAFVEPADKKSSVRPLVSLAEPPDAGTGKLRRLD